MTSGQRVLIGYFTIAYFVPFIGNELFADDVQSSYTIAPVTVVGAVAVVVTLLLALLWSRKSSMALMAVSHSQEPHSTWALVYRRLRIPIGATLLALAGLNFSSGLSSYRYTDQTISETGSPLLLATMVLTVIVAVDMFFTIFVKRRSEATSATEWLMNVFMATVLVVSTNGTASLLMGVCALLAVALPRLADLLLRDPPSRPLLTKGVMTATVLATGFILLFGSWTIGEAIKVRASERVGSAEEAIAEVTDRILSESEFSRNYFYYLVERISTHYYSLLFAQASTRETLNNGEISPIVYPLRSFLFRSDFLLGSPVGIERPIIGSIMRLNYLLLSLNPRNDREGSAPGLVAAFVYMFPFGVSYLLCAAYCAGVARTIDSIIATDKGHLSMLGTVVILLFLQNLVYSPFDLTLVLDDGFIFATLLLILVVANRKRASKSSTPSITPLMNRPAARPRWASTQRA